MDANPGAAWTAAARPPGVGDDEILRVHRDRWAEAAARAGGDSAAFARDAGNDPEARALLDAIFGNSPYLSRCLIADPAFGRLLFQQGPDAAFGAALDAARGAPAPAERTDALMRRLREAKRQAALAIGLADIAGVWPLRKITESLSAFAEATLRASCRHLLRAMHDAGNFALPAPDDPERGSGLIVLGMGKLGAGELNYSSDVDLIVLFDPEIAPCPGGDAQRLFVRLVRRLLRIMEERTADGYVFRTDLRLRPDPSSTPPALSVRAAEVYYETAGRNWERAAMIKARPVAGDDAAGEAFLESLAPFVWRRRLDYAAVQDIQTIKRQIDAQRGGGGIALEGFNVKLGRGGIREIEFFAQAQQLVWGGRDTALRPRGTIAALDALVAAGRLSRRAADELGDAYEFHRGLEHRLQMVNDGQTHSLPDTADGVARAAAFMGFDSTARFADAFMPRLRAVERHYVGLFEDKSTDAEADAAPLVFPADADAADDPGTLRALSEMGYADAARISRRAREWARGGDAAARDERAQALLGELTPAILSAFSASPDPDAALSRFDTFLARSTAGVRLFSLLSAHPELLDLVAEVMGSAPRLAARLTRRPDLLDSVLSRDFSDLEVPDDAGMGAEVAEAARRGLVRLFYSREFGAAEMRAELAEALSPARDTQDIMDTQRRWANDRMFQIGVHVLRGLLSPVEAARPLSDIADACLSTLLPAVEAEFAARHGRVPGGRAALVAFGKLGSREMTARSDLDLLFLYDHEPGAAQSDGPRPLAPSAYYARLCRRLIGAIGAPTAEGALYEVDMRLRPSGNAGPIACSLDAFVNYHRAEAWTWEHQALTRARVICAEGGLGERFDEERRAVLTRPRDRGALAADVAAMRARIRREHGGGGVWNVKNTRGGLLDVEFIAQFLQLLHAAETPEILAADPVSVFGAAAAQGVLDSAAASELADAARLWRNVQGILRLALEGDFVEREANAAFKSVAGRSCGRVVFDALIDSMEETAERTARHFDALLGGAAA